MAQEQRELPLLTVLAWEERWERWYAVPPDSRQRLVRELARSLPDELIAGLLNRLGKRTAKGNSWTRSQVCSLRHSHGIAVYRAAQRAERAERGELVLAEAAQRLRVSPSRVYRLIRSGVLPARQASKGAPWLIAEPALDRPEVRAGLAGKGPLTADPNQQVIDLQ